MANETSWPARERPSGHPRARGIGEAARAGGVGDAGVSDWGAIPGQGASGVVDGRDAKVVSPGYLREQGIVADADKVGALGGTGDTVVYLLIEGALAGAIALGDIVREESRTAVNDLKAMGIRVIMLTGDAEAVARSVADELGLDDFFAEVLPGEKAAKIREIKQRGFTVAMVGDGVNDAPALTEADVGIAIGAGTDVAIESAAVVLARSDPRDVVTIVRLAQAPYRTIVQTLWCATAYDLIAIRLAAGALARCGLDYVMAPAVGAALMSASTVIVAANAQLLRRFERTLA